MYRNKVSVEISLDGRATGHSRTETQSWILQAAQQVRDRAKINAPIDTGFLVNNITIDRVTSRSAVITSHAPYSVFQEEGTRFIDARKYMEDAMMDTKYNFSGKLTFRKY